MKKTLFFFAFSLFTQVVFSQKKVGWYVAPEASAMFLDGHIGRALGANLGLRIFKNRLKIGISASGRSGPINPEAFEFALPDGVSYKGQTKLNLRADHGQFGLLLAPTFQVKKLEIDLPIMLGAMVAGFYLAGDDRKTPDGARVSVWEDQLFDGKDVGFGNLLEVGARAFLPTKVPGVRIGAGLHYAKTGGWETAFDPTGKFYDGKFRASFCVQFGR